LQKTAAHQDKTDRKAYSELKPIFNAQRHAPISIAAMYKKAMNAEMFYSKVSFHESSRYSDAILFFQGELRFQI